MKTINITTEEGQAVVYLRSAASSQPVGAATEAQEARCRTLADKRQLRIRKVYRDIGVSAHRLDRSMLRRLLDDIARKPVDCVIVADPSRLGRDMATHALVRRQIEAAGATIVDGQMTDALVTLGLNNRGTHPEGYSI
jgi:DNA invertase Pin-like site-specific DNA recombinase